MADQTLASQPGLAELQEILVSQLKPSGPIQATDFIAVVRGKGDASEMLAATGADLLKFVSDHVQFLLSKKVV